MRITGDAADRALPTAPACFPLLPSHPSLTSVGYFSFTISVKGAWWAEPDFFRPIHRPELEERQMRVAGQNLDADRDDPLSGDVPGRSEQQKAGDFRGPYGFGRPAHRPDPDAKYGFEPDPNRALPPHADALPPDNAGSVEEGLPPAK
jgi:hypothetical protein